MRLYAPDQTPLLHISNTPPAQAAGLQSARLAAQRNLSPVDVAAPDLARYPRFADASFSEAVLRPGELLFIPAKTWHYVRSLTTAISVNFWF